MSKKFVLKKSYSNFNPALHWNIILVASFAIFLISVVYASYLYLYVKKEVSKPVEVITNGFSTTTTSQFESLKSIKNIQQSLDVYKNRADAYISTMKKIKETAAKEVKIASSSIASSSKQ